MQKPEGTSHGRTAFGGQRRMEERTSQLPVVANRPPLIQPPRRHASMTSSKSNQGGRLNLKAGEWVEVRSREEVLATLDERGCLENVPFMPEMFESCGQKFRVSKRADKTCDPAHNPWTIRRMTDAVHLEGARCDGARHGGCQAGCLIFWKEAWLKRAGVNAVVSLR